MVHRHDSEALDELLDALGNTRRRYALYYVRDCEPTDAGDIASTITDWLSAGSDGARRSARDRSRVRASLYHSDLPKLAEAGLISVDCSDGTVEFEGSGVDEALLDVLVEHERFPGSSTPDDDSVYPGV